MRDDEGYYLVIEFGCKAYECGWINYSKKVSLAEAMKIKQEATEWRQKQKGGGSIYYEVYSSSEPFEVFINRMKK